MCHVFLSNFSPIFSAKSNFASPTKTLKQLFLHVLTRGQRLAELRHGPADCPKSRQRRRRDASAVNGVKFFAAVVGQKCADAERHQHFFTVHPHIAHQFWVKRWLFFGRSRHQRMLGGQRWMMQLQDHPKGGWVP